MGVERALAAGRRRVREWRPRAHACVERAVGWTVWCGGTCRACHVCARAHSCSDKHKHTHACMRVILWSVCVGLLRVGFSASQRNAEYQRAAADSDGTSCAGHGRNTELRDAIGGVRGANAKRGWLFSAVLPLARSCGIIVRKCPRGTAKLMLEEAIYSD